MIRAHQSALLLFLLVCTGVVLWLGYDAHKLLLHLDGVATRAEGIETKVNATLINLDKGTAVWAASAKDQAGAVQDLATDAHGTLSEANTALQNISGVAQHTQGTADAATSLLASAQQTTEELTETLKVGKRTIASFRPVAEDADNAVEDFDALLKDEAIHQTFTNVAGITGHGNAILGDAQKVADKATADFLKPVPWWKQPIKKGSELIDITAAIARHAP